MLHKSPTVFDWAQTPLRPNVSVTLASLRRKARFTVCVNMHQELAKEEKPFFFFCPERQLQHNVFQRCVRAANLHCESRHIPIRLQFACSCAQKNPKTFNDANSLTAETYPSVFKPSERLHTVTLCAPVKAARGTNCSPGLHFLFFSCSKLSGATTALTPYHYMLHSMSNGTAWANGTACTEP